MFSLIGERSNEAVGELVVRDADNGPNPSEDAQPTSRRDHIGQRTKVRAALAGPSRSTIHVGGLQWLDHQAQYSEIRQRRLRLPQVRPSPESRCEWSRCHVPQGGRDGIKFSWGSILTFSWFKEQECSLSSSPSFTMTFLPFYRSKIVLITNEYCIQKKSWPAELDLR